MLRDTEYHRSINRALIPTAGTSDHNGGGEDELQALRHSLRIEEIVVHIL